MNRLINSALTLALLVTTSCSIHSESVSDNVEKVDIRVEGFNTEVQTKGSIIIDKGYKFIWEDTDEVGIFPNMGGYQLGFSLEGQGGKENGSFDGGGWGLRSDAKYSTYYPFNFENRDPKHIPISYLGQCQKGIDNAEHLGDYYFCATVPTAAENGSVSFLLRNLNGLIQFNVTVPDVATYTEMSLVTDANLFPVEGYYNLMELNDTDLSKETYSAITPTKMSSRITLKLEGVTTTSEDQVIKAYMLTSPFDITGHAYKLVLKNSEGGFYTADLSTKSHYVRRKGNRSVTATVKASEGYNIGVDEWGNGGSIDGDAE